MAEKYKNQTANHDNKLIEELYANGPGYGPGRACGICGVQIDKGAGFLRVLRFPPPIIIPSNSPSS
jgi:hypothetical protein